MFVIYLLIVTGAQLDILAMRLAKLGESTKGPTDGKIVLEHDNVLINSIDLYNNILKFDILRIFYLLLIV